MSANEERENIKQACMAKLLRRNSGRFYSTSGYRRSLLADLLKRKAWRRMASYRRKRRNGRRWRRALRCAALLRHCAACLSCWLTILQLAFYEASLWRSLPQRSLEKSPFILERERERLMQKTSEIPMKAILLKAEKRNERESERSWRNETLQCPERNDYQRREKKRSLFPESICEKEK